MASHFPYEHDIWKEVVGLIIGDFIVSFVSGIGMFSAFGHFSYRYNITITEVMRQEHNLLFISSPLLFTHVPASSFFLILHFLILIILPVGTIASLTDFTIDEITRKFPQVPGVLVGFIILLCNFIIIIPLCSSVGI